MTTEQQRRIKIGMGYVTARKQPYRMWKLFYRGTSNEVYPGELFDTAQDARNYHHVQLFKQETRHGRD